MELAPDRGGGRVSIDILHSAGEVMVVGQAHAPGVLKAGAESRFRGRAWRDLAAKRKLLR